MNLMNRSLQELPRILGIVGIHLDLMAKRFDGDLGLLLRHFAQYNFTLVQRATILPRLSAACVCERESFIEQTRCYKN